MKRQLANEPLYGVAAYNPGILSKQELIRLFVARRVLLQQIIDDLNRENPKGIPQHRLLVGARGMGKTTLLRRISYAVEDDEKLSREWLPLTFPEEQYNVARLSDLWLNCLDAVSDALERQGKHDEAGALDEIIDALPDDKEEERARKVLNLLLEQAQKTGQRLLLLFDNVDLIFERLAKEHWTIREMLSKEGAPLLIGATSRPLEPTYEYQGAFYDFFKISNLNKLQLDEMHEVLRTLAGELNAPQVSKLLEQDPARIRVLYDLTGGNPRTTVLLFSVLAQGIDGDVRSYLERLLDQCTPLYKARFEELSSQSQQVVDALALHWDPAPAATVAERARLDVNSTSSHLNRLSEQGIVEKVRLYPKKKTGFQIAERFFNIWYLMRASRRMRRKLIWLSKFLKSFYSQEYLHMGSELDNAAQSGPCRIAEEVPGYKQSQTDEFSCKLKLASILAVNKKWAEAVAVVSPVLHSDSEVADDLIQDVLSFFKSAVTSGYANESITLLEQSELDDSWRPVTEALKAIQAGTTEYFFNIAPEVRSAAEEIYAMLTGNGEEKQ